MKLTLKWWLFFYGVVVFLWLTPDDAGWVVIPLGLCGSLLAAAHASQASHYVNFPIWLKFVLMGALSGAGSAVFTAGLMLFKNGLHNHIYPDYPLVVILGILERLPAWTVVGSLVGLSTALIVSSAHQQKHDEQPDGGKQ